MLVLRMIIFLFFSFSVHANEIQCDSRLKHYLEAIQQVSTGKVLINKILQEGPLQIKVETNSVTKLFHACWEAQSRTIFIDLSLPHPSYEIIASLIFELHNASTNSEYNYLDQLAQRDQIDKHEYVRRCEFVEYQNSIKASSLAEEGITLQIFPRNLYIHVYKDFEEYLHFQRLGGHSAVIAKNYDLIKNGRGNF